MFQVLYKGDNDANFVLSFHNTTAKDNFTKTLDRAGIEYQVLTKEDKKWHCAKVVFDLQLVEKAKKAVAKGEEMKGVYTFGDDKEIVTKDGAYLVECTNAERKIGYAVGVWKATANEIKAFKDKIGYKHLGMVISKI